MEKLIKIKENNVQDLRLKVVIIVGPLQTRAKSHNHDIVRAQKKVVKGRPKTPPKSSCVVTDPQV